MTWLNFWHFSFSILDICALQGFFLLKTLHILSHRVGSENKSEFHFFYNFNSDKRVFFSQKQFAGTFLCFWNSWILPLKCWILSRVACLTGYEPQDLIEKTLYQFIHAGDMVPMRLTHLTCQYNIFFQILNNWNHSEIRNILIKIKNIYRVSHETWP